MSQLRDDVEYTSSWFPEPQGRGTLSILYNCTFTLILCVYTAIHLNIPPAGEPRRWQILRKIKWMFIAIFAPEVVLYTAAYQFWKAWAICEAMDTIRDEQEGGTTIRKEAWWKRVITIAKNRRNGSMGSAETNLSQSPEPFSMTYGFYVVMGGLTVDVSDIHNTLKTVTLSPFGVAHMAQLSSWKHFAVSDTTIDDKSKADTLAKSLVILQISWLFLQCVARASQGKLLTILEIHTLVHAACAILMYMLWLRKPLDIRDATVVDSSYFTNDLALELLGMPIMPCLASAPSDMAGPRLVRDDSSGSLLTRLFRVVSGPFLHQFPSFPEYTAMVFHRERRDDYHVVDFAETEGVLCTLRPGQILHCGMGPAVKVRQETWRIVSWSLTGKDVKRWNRAASARSDATCRSGVLRLDGEPTSSRSTYGNLPISPPISRKSDNFEWIVPQGKIGPCDIRILFLGGLPFVTTVYGAFHLALWNFAFPSHIEMILWKVSACAMASLFVILSFKYAAFRVGHMISRRVVDKPILSAGWQFIEILIGCLPSPEFFTILYVFARVFIVAESFLSLRLVPVGVYEGITWADYIPHL